MTREEALQQAGTAWRKTVRGAGEVSQRLLSGTASVAGDVGASAVKLGSHAAPLLRSAVGKTSRLLDRDLFRSKTPSSLGGTDGTVSHSPEKPLQVIDEPAFDLPPLEEPIEALAPTLLEIGAVVRGQDRNIRLSLACYFAGGHLLLDGPPGLGKTTLARALAAVAGRNMRRIQFTSDLMPGDLLGVPIYDSDAGKFVLHRGPIFSDVVLADEINRAPPRVQSALLEAMEEGCVTIDGKTDSLPDGFFVVATQNPLGQVGAFPLPESQLDRFMMRLTFGHLERAHERELLQIGDTRTLTENLPATLQATEARASAAFTRITVNDRVLTYLQDLIDGTRDPARYRSGLSVRAGLAILHASRTWAWMHGRDWVEPDDIQSVFAAVAQHRLVSADGQADHPGLADQVLRAVAIN